MYQSCKICGFVPTNLSELHKHKWSHKKASQLAVKVEETPVLVERTVETIVDTTQAQEPPALGVAEGLSQTSETIVKPPLTNIQRLLNAFGEIKDGESKSGMNQVMADPNLESFSPEAIFNLLWPKVLDGDARSILRKHLEVY